MSTVAPSVTVRRASFQDAGAVLALAARFAAASLCGGMVPYDEEPARAALLRCLDRGTVLVVELPQGSDPFGTPLPPKIVGGLMAELQTVWHSRQPIAVVLSRWADEGYSLDTLRNKFDVWAKGAQRCTVAMVDGIPERLP